MPTKPTAQRVAAAYLEREAAWGGGVHKHVGPKGRIWLARLGGLSPVVQTNKAAPVRRGYWAFLWPYIEPFLLGSTDDFGPVNSFNETTGEHKTRPSRYTLNKQKKLPLRKFQYEGLLWSRWTLAERHALDLRNGWALVESSTLNELATRTLHDLRTEAVGIGYQRGGPLPYDKDSMEVFVPATGGHVVGRPAQDPGFDEDADL